MINIYQYFKSLRVRTFGISQGTIYIVPYRVAHKQIGNHIQIRDFDVLTHAKRMFALLIAYKILLLIISHVMLFVHACPRKICYQIIHDSKIKWCKTR